MDKHNTSFEPMDVDLSAHSSNEMDVSFNVSNGGIEEFIKKINDSVISTPTQSREDVIGSPLPDLYESSDNILPQTTNIKKFHINMQKDTVSNNSATITKVLCAALVIFLSAIAYHAMNIQCCNDINPDKLRKSLSDKLYGQTRAIDALMEGLIIKERKVLILYGSTGVGKTFAASILLEHVGPFSNVYHYTMPSFVNRFTTDFMIGLTLCKDAIIIIDDLNPRDQGIEVHIRNLLTKSEYLEKVVTVLLIYNHCNTAKDFKRQCDESFPAKIIDNLSQVRAFKKMIRFETLTEEHLRKCITTELGYRKTTDDELTKMLKNFDVIIDGCKGVHTKMKLMDILR